MKTKPRNTAIESHADAMIMLGEVMVHGSMAGAVEAQEAQGSKELVHSESLPVQGSYDPAFAAAGIVFGDPFPSDALFRPATLPRGWSKRRTEHSMWSELVDDKGRKRAGIFYKAAFYDRAAHMSVSRRFGFSAEYDETTHEATRIVVTDAGRVIESFPIAGCETRNQASRTIGELREIREAREAAEKLAEDWLGQHRPDWANAAAYWDVP